MHKAHRVALTAPPFNGYRDSRPESTPWSEQPGWPCSWIGCRGMEYGPSVSAFRCGFELTEERTIRVHVSGDERYELFLDGVRVGRGPERGDRFRWMFETYDLPVSAGRHTLVACVWVLGDLRPWAQVSVRPGFILAPDDPSLWDVLGTGLATWESRLLPGYSFRSAKAQVGATMGTGPGVRIDGRTVAWGWQSGEPWTVSVDGDDDWQDVVVLHPGNNADLLQSHRSEHLLSPSRLPPMMEELCDTEIMVRHVDDRGPGEPYGADHCMGHECDQWSALLEGDALVVGHDHRRRVLVDLGDYVCAYPRVRVSGGRDCTIELRWSEALTHAPRAGTDKGNRDEYAGKHLVGLSDTFVCDGAEERLFEPHWWRAGRFVEVTVTTRDEPLTLDALEFVETRYPMHPQSSARTTDVRLTGLLPVCVRSLQMCMHETYMDCPYYEQLMYAGDTRIQALMTLVLTDDTRMIRKAIEMFDHSRANYSGLTTSAAPSGSGQLIPPFSLWWVAMVHDLALWRGERAFVAAAMVGAREVLDRYCGFRNADGLVVNPPGWTFVDWVDRVLGGRESLPDDVLGAVNWQLVLSLTLAARVEEWLDEPELASRHRRRATELVAALDRLWVADSGAYAEDIHSRHFSQHSQCLALLSGLLDEERADTVADTLCTDSGLAEASIYFAHYLFDTYRLLGRMDLVFERLESWFALADEGFRTTPEHFGETRSDCHAWGGHPLYHYFAGILGIQPAAMGFSSVEIRPQLGPLQDAGGVLAHPNGAIHVDCRREQEGLRVTVELPDSLHGHLVWGNQRIALAAGASEEHMLVWT